MSLPRYTRAPSPPPLRFQERDGELLHAIYERDGLLAKRQIKELFWPQTTQRAMEMRLSLLYHQGYLDWPSWDQRRTKPVSEPVCWLGWRGIAWIADQCGEAVEVPSRANESRLRRFASQLRDCGIRWVREPRWSQLAHDLAIVDFRLAVERAVAASATIRLERWVSEGDFLTVPDVVEYPMSDSAGRSRTAKRQVRPDGYFAIVDTDRLKQGLPARARYLLEVDWGTHDLGSFGKEKIAAGLAYLRSPAYRARFGDNSGRWLVVANGATRLDHLIEQAAQVSGPDAGAFLFTTLDCVRAANVLWNPIWQSPVRTGPYALLAR